MPPEFFATGDKLGYPCRTYHQKSAARGQVSLKYAILSAVPADGKCRAQIRSVGHRVNVTIEPQTVARFVVPVILGQTLADVVLVRRITPLRQVVGHLRPADFGNVL